MSDRTHSHLPKYDMSSLDQIAMADVLEVQIRKRRWKNLLITAVMVVGVSLAYVGYAGIMR